MTNLKEKYGFKADQGLEIGLYSLGDLDPNPHTGETISEEQRINELVEIAVHAEQAGLDIFALGESHQRYFISQAHAVILGAIAQATSKIKLTSGSTIVSTSDPVRIYENFATLSLLSHGRMELIGGRASRVGLYSLLGYDLRDYEELFEEKFDLLNLINEKVEAGELVTWSGQYRAPLNNAEILPKPKDNFLKIWRAVGGPADSAIKAGRAGVPMTLTTLAGPSMAFMPAVQGYRQALSDSGYQADEFPLTTASPLWLGDTVEEAMREFYPQVFNGFYYANGSQFPKQQFAQTKHVSDTMNVGDPSLVIDKLLHQHELYGMDRYIAQIDFGGASVDRIKRVIDLLGEKVLPEVKKYTKS
ncbi:luciferase [Aerococcus urinaehominis]|uniref:Luciferase n=1 Tax=Aerococcus urinaehominis TaxID=128944 RepID=A0A0X8FKM0_9LACT|nr:LLM class flavin-dependent oxidoreductase [Aerococcus urinaehominis]AMB99061.1 luciferase [Aerococcus urinaehominis]SDM59446.1 Flavin-dependent oxidoreductase, luciferase family (includes alkanesulfonate monooxygenase SsuD and methylene tetrahydromethanopterin reductase) [Aerococcus urinaehominis]